MPRVLIAGCGYLGAATADLFYGAGWEVEGWTSTAESAAQLARAVAFTVRAIDITQREQVQAAGGDFEAVIQAVSSRGGAVDDYARIYLDGARNLVAGFPRARLLFTSSTSVYAQTSGEWVDEQSPAEPQRATARILRETEEGVLAHHGIVARLAGIYGPGRSALLRKFLAGDATLGPDSGRYLNQVHRDDAAAALFFLVQHATAAPGVYNLSDGNPLPQRACYEWLAAQLDRPIPPTTATASARKRSDSNKRVSSAKLQALGWAPRYPTFAAGMRESVLPQLETLGA